MKRIVSWTLCALLLLGICPAARAAGVARIGSREDMLLLAADPTGSFELTADIDMGGAAWTPIPFSGRLDGHGHTLYNLTVTELGADRATTYDGNYREYDTAFGGLFSVLRNGEVRDLKMVNAVVKTETDQPCFLGTLAGYAEHSVITGCDIEARNHLTLTSLQAGVGGVAGFSLESAFKNCRVDVELVFTDVNREQRCEEYLGGVYAAGSGQIHSCAVRTRGFAEVYGYAHNGGLIGLFKKVPHPNYEAYVRDTTADTEISFFECADARMAYCSPTIGEDVNRACARHNMKTVHYVRNESKTPVPRRPEACETPQYTYLTTPSGCDSWGYTTHTCAACGYSYKDSYTPPAHQYAETALTPATCTEAGELVFACVSCGIRRTEPIPALGHAYEERITEPTCTEAGEDAFVCARCGDKYGEPIPALGHAPGDWVLTLAPQVDVPGEEQRRCLRCDAVLEWREVEALPHIYAEQVILSAESLTLASDQGALLTGQILPDTAADQALIFTSSDERVATVMANGRIVADRRGTAVITAASADGKASATCTVTVRYTFWQWVKYIFSFRWLEGGY